MTSPTVWLGDQEAKPAPGALRRVQAFINTVDRESGTDRLAHHADARPWLEDAELLAPAAPLTDNDLATIVAVREALRAMTVQNSGGPVPAESELAALRAVLASSTARAILDDDGTLRMASVGDSPQARLLDLLLVVRDAQADGSWSHLKACGNDECRWAFYDRSRNHGGTWCDMSTCGNKLKNREFRARKKI
ncbi:MAG: CGNR zinc finger domain-containing protein [Mycobacterium sp.]|nr:CGNR zinc finger domain-containing protein [Mycobacterium sp.]